MTDLDLDFSLLLPFLLDVVPSSLSPSSSVSLSEEEEEASDFEEDEDDGTGEAIRTTGADFFDFFTFSLDDEASITEGLAML